MTKLWQKLGVIFFWLTLPGSWIYINGSERSRLLLIHDEQILLVRSWFGPGKWELPGGGIKKNESPKAALIREVGEELSIKLTENNLKFLTTEEVHENGFNFRLHYFVQQVNQPPPIKPKKIEISQFAWFKFNDLKSSNIASTVQAAIDAYTKSIAS